MSLGHALRRAPIRVLSIVLLLSLTSCASRSTQIAELPQEQQFAALQKAYDDGEYRSVIESMQRVRFNFHTSDERGRADFLLAMSYYHQEEWPSARSYFQRVINAMPSSATAAQASYMVGICWWEESSGPDLDQTETVKALDQFKSVLDAYPQSAYVDSTRLMIAAARAKLAEKQFYIARLYWRMDDYRPCTVYANEVITDYSDTPWLGPAQLLKGRAFLELGEIDSARAAFTAASTSTDADVASEAHHRLAKLGS